MQQDPAAQQQVEEEEELDVFDCGICLEPMVGKQVAALKGPEGGFACHICCQACIVQWQSSCPDGFTCPLCRRPVSKVDTFFIPPAFARQVNSSISEHMQRARSMQEAARRTADGQRERFEAQMSLLAQQKVAAEQALAAERARVEENTQLLQALEQEKAALERGVQAAQATRARLQELQHERQQLVEQQQQSQQSLQQHEQELHTASQRIQEAEQAAQQAQQDAAAAKAAAAKAMAAAATRARAVNSKPNNAAAGSLPTHNRRQQPPFRSHVLGGQGSRTGGGGGGPVATLGALVSYMSGLCSKKPSGSLQLAADGFTLCEQRGSHLASPVHRALVKATGRATAEGVSGVTASSVETKVVAIKSIALSGGGIGTLREPMLLHRLAHPNVVSLQGLFLSSSASSTASSIPGSSSSSASSSSTASSSSSSSAVPSSAFMGRGVLSLVLEYAEWDLAAWLQQRSMREQQVQLLAGHLVAALHHLHRHGVVHRDLKPSSVLLHVCPESGDLKVKLASFGSAMSLKSSASAHDLSLAPGYCRYWAPELLYAGEPNVQDWKAADCWSLGCVLSEAVSGEPLFPVWDEDLLLASVAGVTQCRADWQATEQEIASADQYCQRLCQRYPSVAKAHAFPLTQSPLQATTRPLGGHDTTGKDEAEAEAEGGDGQAGDSFEYDAYRCAESILSACGVADEALDFILRLIRWNPSLRMRTADARDHVWLEDMQKVSVPSLSPNILTDRSLESWAKAALPQALDLC